MKFVATDGTVFTDRSLYRKHEMETQFTFCNKKSTTLAKKPGSIQGQPFDIFDCQKCTILLLDNCDQVQIDDVVDSKIFIGASSGSVFVRNCKNCTFTVACKQFRTHDCLNCTFNLHCKTEPIIETSKGMKFAPFNGAYPGHRKAMLDADLDPSINKWHAVYDFNDPSGKGENWRLLPEEEHDPMWYPLSGEDRYDVPPESSVWHASESDSSEQTIPSEEETGTFHKIKVFGCNAWSIITQTVCSVQAFCLGLIFSGMQIRRNMISQR